MDYTKMSPADQRAYRWNEKGAEKGIRKTQQKAIITEAKGSKLSQAVTLLTCISEVPGSSHSTELSCGFRWNPQSNATQNFETSHERLSVNHRT
jgi:hypothetical protein